jgi:hypothetical protein
VSDSVEIELEPGITFYVRPREQRWVSPRGPYDRGYYTTSNRSMARKSRLSVYVKNEEVLENFVNRRNRPVDEWRKILRERVLPKFGFPLTGMKWSQYAYCSCPCSPAFILPGWFGTDGPVVRHSWSTCDFAVEIDFALLGESSPSLIDASEVSVRAAQVAAHLANGVAVPAELVEA